MSHHNVLLHTGRQDEMEDVNLPDVIFSIEHVDHNEFFGTLRIFFSG